MIEHEKIEQWAAEAGFDAVGLAAAHRLEERENCFRRWVEAGHHASLGYLARNIDKRFDPRLLVERARTVIVCAVGYKSAVSEGYTASCRTKIATYACNRDYHTTIKEQLYALLSRIREVCPTVQGRAFVDSAPVAEKVWAVEAGLGFIGRQSLLIHPVLGSYLHLGELIITEEADRYDHPTEGVGCGACRRCIEGCPTGAILPEERMIDAKHCIACHTIEQPNAEQIDLDGWIFGCDACQQACPYNRRAPQARNSRFSPLFDPRTLTDEAWLTMREEIFKERFRTTPLLRSGLARIQANVLRNRTHRTPEAPLPTTDTNPE